MTTNFYEAQSDLGLERLLDETCKLLTRYVIFPRPEQPIAMALWVAHTYVLDAFDFTPYLYVSSPERRCGKTRVLEVVKLLAANPWGPVITPSEAVTFRKIERDHPTMLLDEVDAIFGKAAKEHENLRALLDAGFERGAAIPRCVGPRQELKDFDTFCPKVLAGIGHLPDTIADRSLPVELKRKKRGDYTARFRKRQVGPEFASLRDELHAWGELAVETLRGAWPEMPDAIIDRAADAWEPLVAIADSAGGEWWPQQARHAAVALTTGPTTGSEQSIRLRMLGDVRVIVRALDNPGRVPTADLLDGMHKLDESPWSDFYGKPLTAERLAKTLHGYDCFSGTHRVDGVLRKAYLRSDLEDAFERYLPLETPSTRNTLNNPHGYAENGPSQPVTNTADVTGSETPQTLMVDPMLRVLRVGAVDMGPDVLRNLLDRLADVLNERHANRQMTMDDAQGVWAQAVLLGAHELELLVAGLEEGDLA